MLAILKKITKNIILKRLTVEAVQDFLSKVIEAAKKSANQTETKVDDWILDFLENIVKDRAKVQALVNKAQELIACIDGGVCYAPDSDAKVQYLTACLLTGGEPLEREVELTRSLVEILAENKQDES